MKKIMALILSFMFIAMSFGGLNVAADDLVIVFEDEVFKDYIRFETGIYDRDIRVSDVRGITEIIVYNMGITSLKGIEYMTSLQNLMCPDNAITSLDVSGFTSLSRLECSLNSITSLNVSGCTGLEFLMADNNLLTSIDLSDCSKLRFVNMNENKNLTNISVSPTNIISSLRLSNCAITSVDLSLFPRLGTLYVSHNDIKTIDLSAAPELRALYIDSTSLTTLDISANFKLSTISMLEMDLPNKAELIAMENMEIWYTQDGCSYFSDNRLSGNLLMKAIGVTDMRLRLSYWNDDYAFSFESNSKPIVLKEILRADGLTNLERDFGGINSFSGYFTAEKTDENAYVELLFEDARMGDLDVDGRIDVSDVIRIRAFIIESHSFLTERELQRADFDGNGELDVSDLVALKNIIMNG